MKKNLLLLAALCGFGCMTVHAQTENPRGLYRLQTFTYGNTTDIVIPSFQQYYYCTDTGHMFMAAQESPVKNNGYIWLFNISNNDHGVRPLNYTGKVPVGDDGLGIEVYDSNKKKFTLRWYNKDFPNNMWFPYHAFTNEHYTKKDIAPQMKRVMEILTHPVGKPVNKLIGVWRRRGMLPSEDLTGNSGIYSATDMYRIHTEKEMMLLYEVHDNNGAIYADGELRECTYYGETATKEGPFDCIIKWLTDDCFSLSCIINEKTIQCEMWDRCGLPESFQQILGTNVPINIPDRPDYRYTGAMPPPDAPQVAEILDIVDHGDEIIEEKIGEETFRSSDNSMQTLKNGGVVTIAQYPSRHPNISDSDEEAMLQVADQDPQFPGGEDALCAYVIKNLRYPASAVENCIQGVVYVCFVVDKDGSIVEPYVVRPVDPALDREAMRVIQHMPQWQPGTKNGEPVRVQYTLPFTFKLEQETPSKNTN